LTEHYLEIEALYIILKTVELNPNQMVKRKTKASILARSFTSRQNLPQRKKIVDKDKMPKTSKVPDLDVNSPEPLTTVDLLKGLLQGIY
jgi:hypothetical protein